MDFKSYIKHSDCFDEFKNINDNTVDLVCVDLPYGQTNNKWDKPINLTTMWLLLNRICKDRCIYVFFCTTKYGYELIESNYDNFRYDLVWKKNIGNGWFNAKKQPLRSHEMIYVFYNKVGTYNPQKVKGKPWKHKGGKYKDGKTDNYNKTKRKTYDTVNTDRYPKSVLEFNIPTIKKKYHKTQKPTDILEWIIKTYSNDNDIVLDFTMGSGSTIEACINTNRRYIGIEKDNDIFYIAKNRIDNIHKSLD
tara:strand:- start:93 stop:839 length:747 start_codon:yes stop_codon:yes gene_type:complete